MAVGFTRTTEADCTSGIGCWTAAASGRAALAESCSPSYVG